MIKTLSGRWILGVMLLVASLPVRAQEATAAVAQASGDRGIEDFKQAMLELGVERLQRLDPSPAAGDGLINVFAGPGSSGARLLSAALTIDDQAAIAHTFGPAESAALYQAGLFRLARIDLTPGEHRLRASLVLRPAGAPDGADPISLDLDQTITLAAGATDIEFQAERESPLSAWHLRLDSPLRRSFGTDKGWSVAGLFKPVLGDPSAGREVIAGSEDDPVVRYARFLAANAEYLDAAITLEQLPRQVPGMALAPAYSIEQCRVLAQYGLLDRARAAAQLAASEGAADDAWGARLDLAEAYLQRGSIAAAGEVLGMPPRGKPLLLARWRDIKSRLLIARGQLGAASEFLQRDSSTADYDAYVRYYNLAMAYIAEGRVDQGLTVLDRVGQLQGTSSRLQTLIDRANLSLGAYFLHDGQGGTAIPILERIGESGLYANRAFLDLGWAWLAPKGVIHKRVEVGDERSVGVPPEAVGKRSRPVYDQNLYQRYNLGPFTRVQAGGDREARLKQALAIWSRILDRDPEDESVQEALLASAYAEEQLGAHQETIRYLEKAKAALQLSLRSFDGLVKYLDGDRFVDDLVRGPLSSDRFARELDHLPPPELARYVYETLAGAEFQRLLADDRDLQVMSARLADWAPGTAAAAQDDAAAAAQPLPDADAMARLRDRMTQARMRDIGAMRQLLDRDLEPQIRWRLKLLETTRLELARLYDASTPGASP